MSNMSDEIIINVQGHTKELSAVPNCTCGGEYGVAFTFHGEGGWIIPWEDLEYLLTLKSQKPIRGIE